MELGIEFRRFPITDHGIPDSADAFLELIGDLYDASAKDRGIVAHCLAGIGRSTMVAASLLVRSGLTLDEVARIGYRSSRNESTRCYFCKNKCLRTFIDVNLGGNAKPDEEEETQVPVVKGDELPADLRSDILALVAEPLGVKAYRRALATAIGRGGEPILWSRKPSTEDYATKNVADLARCELIFVSVPLISAVAS